MSSWPYKDPNEELDYQFDWAARLETGETITSSTFIKESGSIVLGASNNVGALTTVWITGGTEGEVCIVVNRIITSAGRIYDETAKLRIRSR